MKKPVIAVDIDDVLADSTETFRKVSNSISGANLTREHYQIPGDYSKYYERVWAQHGLHKKLNYSAVIQEIYESEIKTPLLAGANFAIKELAKQFDIIIITARPPELEKFTRAWLNEHLEGGFIEVYFTQSHPETTEKTKGELCRIIGAKWLIDDNPEFCQSAQEHGVTAVLFGEYGWHNDIPHDVIKCKDWPAVLEYFNDEQGR